MSSSHENILTELVHAFVHKERGFGEETIKSAHLPTSGQLFSAFSTSSAYLQYVAYLITVY